MNSLKCGLDVFMEQKAGQWREKKLGVILHQASVTRKLEPALQALHRIPGLRISALFSPEHGLTGAEQDQISISNARDPSTGLPVHSLYGNQRSPTKTMLRKVDLLVFDLQDIGVRYYTFVWTMALAIKAAGERGIPFLVLDRPNPLGGRLLEGNLPDPSYASFVGLYPLPVRHGMTCGELALFLNDRYRLGCEISVVKMHGWKRSHWHDQTGSPWVSPSPNMPTLQTAAVYAGMCLVEGTNLSEGRGTTRPFEMVGAPFLEPDRLARELNSLHLPGIVFRPCSFQPAFHKWSGQTCHGVQLHMTDRERFRSFLTGLLFLQTVRRLYPKKFRWRPPPYEYETIKLPIDILCGTDRLRKAIDEGLDIQKLEARWESDLRAFRNERTPYLLYD